MLPKQFSFRSGKSCFSAAVNEKPIDRTSGSNFPALSVRTHTQLHIDPLTHTVAVSFWHSLRRVAFHFNAKLMTLTLVHLPPLFITVPHTALAALTLFVISLCTHFSLLSVVCFAHESLVWHIARSSDPLGVRTLTHTHVPRVTAQALSVCP